MTPTTKKPFWATAKQVKELTKMTDSQLRAFRRNNPELLKVGKGNWLYNLNEFPEQLFKKSIA